jgi:peptide-methionine (S)-S-oxide reductase
MQKATFAAGCFWQVESAFRKLKGVISTAVGFTGGSLNNPSYKQVCSDETGHAEAIEIVFDPKKVPYKRLLDVFWKIHDPTQLNRQGPDTGKQYRSAIFYHNEKQKKEATSSKTELQKKLKDKIATEIVPAAIFYKAEEYHQRYLEKRHPVSDMLRRLIQ